MKTKKITIRISMMFLALGLIALPQLSYADWGVKVHVGDSGTRQYERDRDEHSFYRWHDHPRWGVHTHFLPEGYVTVGSGWHRYYYYDGLYYTYVGGDYVLVSPPVGVYVNVIPPDFQPVIISGRTYYTDNGVYYILTRHHGYKVVRAPVVRYVQPQQVVVYGR